MSNHRDRVQKLLQVDLPTEAADLHVYDFQPDSDLSYHTTYVKFRIEKAGFGELMSRLQAKTGDDDVGRRYLPAAWHTPQNLELDWWNPSADTPPDAAAKAFGFNGWLVAKYEQGWAYLIATDTGQGVP
jgi:hypothetical protein